VRHRLSIDRAGVVGRWLDRYPGEHLPFRNGLELRVYPFNVTLVIVGVVGDKAPPNFLLFRRDYLEEASGRPGMIKPDRRSLACSKRS